VAVHINAFNFPAWGTFEKVAVALLAGVPVISKPATATALVAWRMARIAIEAAELPDGALQFVAGSTGDLLDRLGPQDVVAFTGSAATAARLRAGAAFTERSARFNAEADSLNAAVLGPDVAPGDPVWNLALRNIVVDMTQKTGQKCTAVRRILVPQARLDDLREALVGELRRARVGNTASDAVTMGPVATSAQLRDVRAGIELLASQAEILTGGADPVQGLDAPEGRGFYVAPTLLQARDALQADRVHRHEVFGPCATLLPYDGSASAAARLVALGQGSLVSTIYADDRAWLGEALLELAPWNGRVLVASDKVADQTTPPGMVLPTLVHGGPGRAGGGEELGGTRGMDLYTQRVAIQGDTGLLKRLLRPSA
jgi:oxepin-CoA hydrolase/3-oxo-5,6-dehydrosuberyl-CoA semialdehyde dehydrogenase